MKREYKVTKTTTSLIKYHFVFCPKYRRKIFLIHGVEERMKELTKEQCEKDQIEILEMKCDVDHVYLYVRAYPQTTITRIMGSIREYTSKILRKEFKELSKLSYKQTFFNSSSVKSMSHKSSLKISCCLS